MSGFQAEGAGDLTRPLILRDASKGTDEPAELGWFNSLIVGVVDVADGATGMPTKVRSGFLEPRNWHESELAAFSPDLPDLKDRRYAVSLIADHEHDFPKWALDQDTKSPFLDDWFYDQAGDRIQKSTRIVDEKDPKGRTALLAQLVKVIDDHNQQYTPALVMGRDVGNHDLAAAGYVWDNQKNFSGLLDTFFETRHSDAYGAGREGTPYGILSERTDAHFDWPGSFEHGRIHFQRIDLSQVPVGGIKYKCSLGFDPTVANVDSELGKESGQWRPWYHCVDGPEKDPRKPPPPGDPGQPPPPPPEPPFPGMPVVPDPPTPFVPRDDLIVGLEALKKLLRQEEATRRPSPAPEGEGRIIGLPLSHNPPLGDGLVERDHGYLAISEEPDGGRALWIDGRRNDAPEIPAFWDRVLSIPKETPAGKVPVSDGKGGWSWGDAPCCTGLAPDRPARPTG